MEAAPSSSATVVPDRIMKLLKMHYRLEEIKETTAYLMNSLAEACSRLKERGECFDIAMAEEKAHVHDCLQRSSRLQCYATIEFQLVADFCTRNTRDNLSGKLSWADRYKVIKGICEGLHYLHNTPIYNLDLKPHNVLLDDCCVPKISDFGISMLHHGSHNTTVCKVSSDPLMDDLCIRIIAAADLVDTNMEQTHKMHRMILEEMKEMIDPVDTNTKVLDNLRKERWRLIKERRDCFDIAMAEEQAHLGDCNSYLFGELEWYVRYKIIKGICEGLQYLHETRSMCPMDLKPSNILLDDSLITKISDFGLRPLHGSHNNTARKVGSISTLYSPSDLRYFPCRVPIHVVHTFLPKRFSSDNYLCGENDMPEVILDNQAHVHCTGNFNMLSNLNIGRENVVLIAANGEEMGTFMSGSVHMGNFSLPDVHYCPELGNRIIVSGSILDNDDYGYEFARGKFTVRDLKNDTSIGEGHLVDGNYNVTAHMVGSTDTFYSPGYVEFAVEASPKGGSVIKIGSHVIHVPKYLSVHHPLVQMVLFARKKFADTFACCESMAPKSIFDMAKRLHAFALSNWWKIDWNLARPKSGSHPSDTGASGAVWIAATAAPHHATGNRNLLAGFIIEHDDLFVHVVDGVPRKVLARGAVITDSVVLPDVWFVPGLAENLASVSQLVDLDHSVGFSSGKCCIRRTDGKVVGKGRLQEGGQYVVDFLKVSLAI